MEPILLNRVPQCPQRQQHQVHAAYHCCETWSPLENLSRKLDAGTQPQVISNFRIALLLGCMPKKHRQL